MENSIPIFKTDRLLLIAPTKNDIDAYRYLFKDKRLIEYTNITPKLIDAMIKGNLNGKFYSWIIKDIITNELFGAIRINSFNHKRSFCEIGYEIGVNYWGKGYTTEALKCIINFAHNDLKLNRIEAWTLPGNTASDKVLLNNGFIHEATLRESFKFKRKLVDVKYFGRLAHN